MAQLRLTQQRWALIALAGTVIASCVVGLAVISQSYYAATQATLRAKNAILILSELEGNLKDSETGQRGYLLTGNKTYLEPYQVGIGAIKLNLSRLDALLGGGDAVSRDSFTYLQHFTKLKLTELEQTINLRAAKGLAAALPIVENDTGKIYMDQIRGRANRIRFAQESSLSTNTAILNQLDSVRNSIFTIIGLASTSIFWLMFQSFKQELSLRKQIQVAQEGELQLQEQAVAKLKDLATLKERELSLRIHDWKNPVTSIQSSIELLKYYCDKEQLSQSNFDKHYQRIQNAIDTLLNGYNDALLVAKAEAGKLEITKTSNDLVIIAQNSIFAVEGKIQNHTLRLYTSDLTMRVQCDKGLVQRAIVNLLENALKHTSMGEIALCLSSDARGSYIQVADQGDGIPPQDLTRLFKTFERGNTEASGTGLGLAVVRSCAEAHNGTVKVESRAGLTVNHPEALTYNTVFTMAF